MCHGDPEVCKISEGRFSLCTVKWRTSEVDSFKWRQIEAIERQCPRNITVVKWRTSEIDAVMFAGVLKMIIPVLI
jgi:hypothetical protein